MDSTQKSNSEFSNDEDLEESPPHHHSLHDITDITDDIECDDEVISHQHTQSLDHVDSHYGIGTQRSEIKDSHNLDQTTSSDGEINVRNTRERHKQHKRQRKKVHKATVDENSLHKTRFHGGGNCFSEDLEEEGDNIDQQVAPAYENLLNGDQRRESIFMETMEDYMRRLDKHSHQEQTLAPSEQKSVAAPAFKTEVLERGGNRKWSMGATRKSMYALKAVLRMFS